MDELLHCRKVFCPDECRFHGYVRLEYSLCRICKCYNDPCLDVKCPKDHICSTFFHRSVASCIRRSLFIAFNKANALWARKSKRR
ncbi:hypothetical protein SNEBB_003362 [Seison nebaliae]|nr:hypothetical protein SNEBB_003362 [Seison nebaliae]